MPNIIINNYCNQACSYCFANENMKDESLKKNMSLSTYLSILKYLKFIGDNNVRILGGEPIIFPKLREYIDIAEKGGFDIIVFSNINIHPQKFKKIFYGVQKVRVNCNINDESFYSLGEKKNIHENLEFLQQNNIKTIIGYNITRLDIKPDFHFKLAKKYSIHDVNLKVTNTCLGEKSLLLDTKSREFGTYIFEAIQTYNSDFNIELSCGLSKEVFSQEELHYIKKIAKIDIYFGCEGHRGKFDINTDGNIFKCYPLESLYKNNPVNIVQLAKSKISLESLLEKLYAGVYSDGECTAHKSIKGFIKLG